MRPCGRRFWSTIRRGCSSSAERGALRHGRDGSMARIAGLFRLDIRFADAAAVLLELSAQLGGELGAALAHRIDLLGVKLWLDRGRLRSLRKPVRQLGDDVLGGF